MFSTILKEIAMPGSGKHLHLCDGCTLPAVLLFLEMGQYHKEETKLKLGIAIKLGNCN